MAAAKSQYVRKERKPAPPLDADGLNAAALRYVERFQTTRARLVRLLRQKLRARGWAGEAPPEPEAIAERLAALGYIDDAAFADARARGMARRGLGGGRVRQSLAAYGVAADDAAPAMATIDAFAAALELARRKRLGPWGPPANDPKLRQRQLAAMARGGHSLQMAKAILGAIDPDAAEALRDQFSYS
jgi:regulatory protein